MIERMRDAGVRVVLLSNGQSCYVRPELDLIGLSKVFDDVIISSEEGDVIGAKSAGIDGVYFHTEISPSFDPEVSAEAVRSFSGTDYDGLLDFVLNS